MKATTVLYRLPATLSCFDNIYPRAIIILCSVLAGKTKELIMTTSPESHLQTFLSTPFPFFFSGIKKWVQKVIIQVNDRFWRLKIGQLPLYLLIGKGGKGGCFTFSIHCIFP